MKQTRTISFLQFQLPALVWMLFIFTVSAIPATKVPSLIFQTDKLVHGCVFFMQCWLFHVAFRFQEIPSLKSNSLMIAIILTSMLGATDEFHQMFTPGRTVDFFDWLADTIGALLYAAIYSRYKFYDVTVKE